MLALVIGLPEPSGLGWKAVTVYPERAFLGSIDKIRNVTLISMLVAMLFFGLLSFVTTGYIARQVRKYSAFADDVAEGRWSGESKLEPMPIREIEAFRLDLLNMRERLRLNFEELRAEIERRRRSEKALEESRQEKELLLHEVHHRIKNNMNSMMSLLSLQASATGDEGVKSALLDAEARLASMMLLYDKLYRSDSVSSSDAAIYLGDITDSVATQMGTAGGISICKDLQPLVLDASRLMPLGIAANELITNALKHAFPGRGRGEITVRLFSDDGLAHLVVEDDGIGMSPEADRKGFGMAVVEGTTAQIGGGLIVRSGEGTRIELRFPM